MANEQQPNFVERLQEVAIRINKVVAALPNTSEDVLVVDQLQYAHRRLQAHSQKPFNSPRQLTLVGHDLAAAGYWLAFLAANDIIPAPRLSLLQRDVTCLIKDLQKSSWAATAPARAPSAEQLRPTGEQMPPLPTATASPELPPPPPDNWLPDNDAYISSSDQSESKQRRVSHIKIEYQKHTYTWTGTTWHDENYLKPPQVIVRALNQRLDAALVEEDNKLTDIHELIDRARKARDTAQYSRAERLSRRILELEPDNHAGAAMLCAALRARHRPRQALEETDRFAHSGNPALLTSRAAACCDLGLWEEARRFVSQSLAIAESEEAFMVVKRIKSEHPELYRK